MAFAHVVHATFGMTEEGGGHESAANSVNVVPMLHAPQATAPRIDPDITRRLLRLVDQISTVIVGKRPQIEDCVACPIAGGAPPTRGHAYPLIEAPGDVHASPAANL